MPGMLIANLIVGKRCHDYVDVVVYTAMYICYKTEINRS